MLGQPRAALHYRSAAIAHHGAAPPVPPGMPVKDGSGAGMRLIKGGHDSFARLQRLIAGKTTAHWTVKESPLRRVLQTAGDSQALQVSGIEHEVQAICARGMKVDRQKEPRDADLMVLKSVVAGMRPSGYFHGNLWRQLLRNSRLKITLAVAAYIPHAQL